MWRSKMAAQWRRKDGNLNTGNSKIMAYNIPNELVLSRSEVEDVDMDAQSCVDHSILAIFEDSSIASKCKNGADEESETLLSALTEMLDSVEDDDGHLSPFDTLPDYDLLGHSDHRDSPVELPTAHRLRPQPKPPHATLKARTEGENDWEHEEEEDVLLPVFKKQKQTLCSKSKTAEPEVEVFTSTSLASLVKLMHSYCLKMHMEDEDEIRTHQSLFSQEEVWRYERPNEESDEEINVVSDDEAPVAEPKGVDEVDGRRDNGHILKGVLLNGNMSRTASSRQKKRVSFGPVQVALFDESLEKGLKEKSITSGSESIPLKSTEALETPACSAFELLTQSSERDDEAEVEKEKSKVETKAKSLSLQQYRQLRQTRQPLVEKRVNYTTKWPSVSETPKELTPILCFQEPNYKICSVNTTPLHKPEQETHHSSDLPEVSRPSFLHHSGLLCPRTESTPLQDLTANAYLIVSDGKKSSTKKPKLLSSDPPNPVLLPLPLPKTPSTANLSSGSILEARPEASRDQVVSLEPPVSSGNQGCNQNQFTEAPPDAFSLSPSQTVSPLESNRPKKMSLPSQALPRADTRLKQVLPDPTEGASPTSSTATHEAVKSGIEAPDLTSLLEQFEETQAIEDRVNENKPKLISVSSLLNLQTDAQSAPAGEPSEHWMWESVNVQEPFCTEIILSTLPARRKNPLSKAIQLIDPQPLPCKRTQIPPSESPAARVYSHLSTDHDYCRLVDQSAAQYIASKSSLHREAAAELQLPAQESGSAEEQLNDAADGEMLVLQRQSEADLSTEKALQLSDMTAAGDYDENKERAAPCSLPTPPPSPPPRGRDRRRYGRSPQSDCSSRSSSSSSSTSASRSPKRRRVHRRRSESTSCSWSPYHIFHSPPRPYRMSYTRSRCSRSRSPCRSRSPSPQIYRQRWRCSSSESRRLRMEHDMQIHKLKAIDERRVVYVGRIRRTMTNDELTERFSQFGEVECVSLHFRDQGDHYGFVTFYNTEDAFAAIDNGGKLRKSDELPFDICFGGRRQFCNSDYADLDANRDADLSPTKSRFEDVDFDSLLKQAQRGLKT